MPDNAHVFCLIGMATQCIELEVQRQKIFGTSELISGIAFVAIPLSLMSREAKLRMRMSTLGANKNLILNFIILFSLATISADYASLSIFSSDSYIQLYIQQFQVIMALLYVILIYFWFRAFFVNKVILNERNAVILSAEIRRENIIDGAHPHTSNVLAECLDDLIQHTIPLKSENHHAMSELIELMSSDGFVRFVVIKNPYLAQRLSILIKTSKASPGVFDKFFSNFIKHAVKSNPSLIDDFANQLIKERGSESIIGDICYNDRLMQFCPLIFWIDDIDSKAEIERLAIIVLNSYAHAAKSGLLHSKPISSGLIALASLMSRYDIPAESLLLDLVRKINASISKNRCDSNSISREANDTLTVAAWARFILVIPILMTHVPYPNGHAVRVYCQIALNFSYRKNTWGRLLVKHLLREVQDTTILANDTFGLIAIDKVLNMAFIRRPTKSENGSDAHSLIGRFWHRKKKLFKYSIQH